MSKPTHAAEIHAPIPGAPPTGVGVHRRADAREEVFHSNAELLRRRLHFYVDLLGAGYRQALRPDPLSRSLRAERIALGIDLPELDTVPLWSARGQGGTICVPFVEFILGQIADDLEALSDEVAPVDPSAAREIEAVRQVVVGALEEIGAGGEPAPTLPRLRDVFVPASTLEALCGPGGCVAPVVRRHEACAFEH